MSGRRALKPGEAAGQPALAAQTKQGRPDGAVSAGAELRRRHERAIVDLEHVDDIRTPSQETASMRPRTRGPAGGAWRGPTGKTAGSPPSE